MNESVSIRPTRQSVIVLTALLIVYVFLMHWNHLSDGPAGMHLWTQSDHYALARGFVENNLNFFKPQTLVYHYHYPETWDAGKQSLVTAVDFPIHNYIPAVIMKLTGSESPMICSIYMLLVSLTGLIYLYKLAFLFNRSTVISFLIVFFVAASPVFTFYQIRFIPSVPSLSTSIIGLFYGFSYRKTGNFRHFTLGIVFLTLAALTRMTFIIPLLAWCGQELLFFIRSGESRKRKALVVISCFAVFIGYFCYNFYLRNTYGGMFLNALLPANSRAQLTEIVREVFRNWKFEYLTKAHYVVVLTGILVLCWRFLRRIKGQDYLPTRWFTIFLLTGSAVFFLIMTMQFPAHDYYGIDVFFVPMIVLICLLSERIRPHSLQGIAWIPLITAVIAIPVMIFLNRRTQQHRFTAERWGLNTMVVRNFENSQLLIDSLIPKNEKLVVLDPLPRNVPFIYMHRTGYVVMRTRAEDLKDALEMPMRYYVFQNETFLSTIYKVYPNIISKLMVLGTDGKITVCRKRDVGEFTSLFHFLQLDTKKTAFMASLHDTNAEEWEVKGARTADSTVFEVLPSADFGPVLKVRDAAMFRTARVVYFNGKIDWDGKKDIQCVVSLAEKSELTFYKAFSLLETTPRNLDDWSEFRFLIPIPEAKGDNVELSVYLWNTEHVPYRIKDVEAKLY